MKLAGGPPPGPVALDETNQRILQILVHEGRSTMRDLADAVGRSESTVRERVGNLEMRGVLLGYEARIDWALAGLPLLALFKGDCPPGRCGDVAAQLDKIPNVVQALVTTGPSNVVVLVRARDLQNVNGLRVRLSCAGLANLEAAIALEPLVHERQPTHTFKAQAQEARRSPGTLPQRQPAPARPLLAHQGTLEEVAHASA